MSVWSLTLAAAAAPSTVTATRLIPPRRAAMVLSSTRSIGPPDVFRMTALESTEILRVLQDSRSVASYVASRSGLERPTAPGTMSLAVSTAAAGGRAAGAGAGMGG